MSIEIDMSDVNGLSDTIRDLESEIADLQKRIEILEEVIENGYRKPK